MSYFDCPRRINAVESETVADLGLAARSRVRDGLLTLKALVEDQQGKRLSWDAFWRFLERTFLEFDGDWVMDGAPIEKNEAIYAEIMGGYDARVGARWLHRQTGSFSRRPKLAVIERYRLLDMLFQRFESHLF